MRPWNTLHAIGYGAAIGLAAAAFKLFGPWGEFWGAHWAEPQSNAGVAKELIGAMLAFAVLCGLAAALRNFVLRRLSELEH
jgi:hypothetical protein